LGSPRDRSQSNGLKVSLASARMRCAGNRGAFSLQTRNALHSSPLVPLFVLCLAAYLFSAGGHFYVADHMIMYSTTKAIAERGSLNIAFELGQFAKMIPGMFPWFSEDKPAYYSFYGVLQPLLAVPLYLAGKWIGVEPWRVVTTVFGPVVSAATVCAVYAVSRRLGDKPVTSTVLALLYGFSTIVWPYVKFFFDSITATFMIVASLYFLFDQTSSRRSLVYSGIFATLAFLGRIMSALILPAMILYVALKPQARLRAKMTNLASFLTPIVIGALFFAYLNIARFGSPLYYGGGAGDPFNSQLYSMNPLIGAYGMLLSSGEGLFLYSPICALGFFALFDSRHERKWERFVLCEFFLATLLFYARMPWWHGWGSPWGARYLVLTLPCLIVAMGPFFESTAKTIVGRIGLVIAAAIGVFLNFVGVLIDSGYSQAYLFDIGAFDPGKYPEPGIWIPRFSPLEAGLRLLYSETYPAVFYQYANELMFLKSRFDLYLYYAFGPAALIVFSAVMVAAALWLVKTLRRGEANVASTLGCSDSAP